MVFSFGIGAKGLSLQGFGIEHELSPKLQEQRGVTTEHALNPLARLHSSTN